jgi:hypothetical protein
MKLYRRIVTKLTKIKKIEERVLATDRTFVALIAVVNSSLSPVGRVFHRFPRKEKRRVLSTDYAD